jgi:hypothetical protein
VFGKSLELLKEVAPAVTRVGFIFNPDMSAYYDQFLPAFETQARQYSIELTVARVSTEAEIDAAVAKLAAAPGGGLIGAAGCLYFGPPRPDRAVDGAAPDPPRSILIDKSSRKAA